MAQIDPKWPASSPKMGKTFKRRAAKRKVSISPVRRYIAASDTAIGKMKTDLAANPQKLASRVASQKTIEALVTETDCLFGGSADLKPNNTKAAERDIYSAQNPAGHYIHYGVREHGMAAAMNGIALHGGAIPYGGTFLVFTDYSARLFGCPR